MLKSCRKVSITCDMHAVSVIEASGVPRNFVLGGFNKFSSGQRTERMGIWDRWPTSQGFWRQL